MSVTNRKMFRRDARNKLRNMGGIMASSEPLIQEVAKFQDGNSVYFPATPNLFIDALSRIGLIPKVAQSKDIRVSDPSELSGSQLSEALKSSEAPGVETRFGAGSRFIRSIPDVAAGAVSDVFEEGLKFLNPKQLTNQSIINVLEGKVPRSSVQGIDMQAQIANSTLPNKSELLGINENLMNLPRDLDQFSTVRLDPGKAAAVGQEFVTVDSTGKILTDQSQAPKGTTVTMGEGRDRREAEEEALRKGKAAATLSIQEAEKEAELTAMREAEKQRAIAGGMPMPNQEVTDTFALQQQISGGQLQSGRDQTLGVTKQQEETYKALQSGDASGAKKNIEEIMKGGAGAQQAGLQQLIKEFTDNAPEYEGVDKNLVLAKIGFTMAEGKSPNAVVNIATALNKGADMLIEDDVKKKDFKRQVHLSGLQYGLGELSKMRAEDRAQARELLKQKFEGEYMVVQDEQGNYQQVFVSNYDRATKGLPKGALTSSFVESMLDKKAKASAFDKELLKSAVVSYSEKATFVEDYTTQVDNIISSTNAAQLLEQVIIKNEQGRMTGFGPAMETAVTQALATIGKDGTVPKSYKDKELARSHLKIIFQKLIPLTLGEAQTANSISNKDVDRLADAFLSADILEGGIFSLLATPKAVLRQKLQFTLGEFHKQQEGALAKLNDLENGDAINLFFGVNTASGTPKLLGSYVGSQRARIQPFLKEGFRNSYLTRDGGVYKLVRPNAKA